MFVKSYICAPIVELWLEERFPAIGLLPALKDRVLTLPTNWSCKNPFGEPVLTRVVIPGDARIVIDLNQYKYTNVLVATEYIANWTSNELVEVISEYKERQVRA